MSIPQGMSPTACLHILTVTEVRGFAMRPLLRACFTRSHSPHNCRFGPVSFFFPRNQEENVYIRELCSTRRGNVKWGRVPARSARMAVSGVRKQLPVTPLLGNAGPH